MTLPRKRKFKTRHHILPKSRMGTGERENILILWNDKHELYHALFGDRTLVEAANLLMRIDRSKRPRKSHHYAA